MNNIFYSLEYKLILLIKSCIAHNFKTNSFFIFFLSNNETT